MNRVSRTFPDVEALLDVRECEGTINALLVSRIGLIETIRRSLAELHEHRRLIAHRAAEAEALHRIKYWETILGWLKDQGGSDVIFTSPRRA